MMQLGYQPKIAEPDLRARCLTPRMIDFLRTIAKIERALLQATSGRVRQRTPQIGNIVAHLANEAEICGWVEIVSTKQEADPVYRLTPSGWGESGETKPPFS